MEDHVIYWFKLLLAWRLISRNQAEFMPPDQHAGGYQVFAESASQAVVRLLCRQAYIHRQSTGKDQLAINNEAAFGSPFLYVSECRLWVGVAC